MQAYTIFDVLQVPLKHKAKVLTVAAVVFVIAILAIRFWPRSYGSEAKLFVRMGRENMTLDPTVNVGKTNSLQTSRQSEINSAVEILSSRVLVEKVVDKLEAELDQAGKAKSGLSEWASSVASSTISNVKSLLGNDPEVDKREKRVTKLMKKIAIETTKESSNVITAYCEGKTPEMAQRFLQELIDTYLAEHARISSVDGSYAFFKEQTEGIESELFEAREELRRMKTQGNIASLEAQQTSLEEQIADLQKEAYLIEADADASIAKTKSLEEMLSNLPDRLQAEEAMGFDNAVADDMREQLFRIEMERASLEAALSPSHPRVAAVRERANRVQEMVDATTSGDDTRTRRTTALNPHRQQIAVLLSTEKATAAGLAAESRAIDEKLKAARNSLAKLNEHEIALKTLENRVQVLDDSYKTYQENSEQARINEALELAELSNIAVIQPPNLIRKPASPKKLKYLVLGVLGAIFSGLAVAFLAEQADQTLVSEEDVERETGWSVLGSTSESDRSMEQREQEVARTP